MALALHSSPCIEPAALPFAEGSGSETRGVGLTARQIDLWSIPLRWADRDSVERIARCVSNLSDDEQQRAVQYRDRRRTEFIITRGTMRQILARYASAEPALLVFEVGAHGKPALANSVVQFNLTHSAGLALLAVSANEIGIDVERVRPVENAIEIAQRCFDAAAAAAIRSAPVESRSEVFLRHWTAREALLKAAGEALDELPLASPIETSTATGEVRVRCGGSTWWLRAIRPAPEYIGAIAVAASGLRVVQRQLGSFSEEEADDF